MRSLRSKQNNDLHKAIELRMGSVSPTYSIVAFPLKQWLQGQNLMSGKYGLKSVILYKLLKFSKPPFPHSYKNMHLIIISRMNIMIENSVT